MTFPRIKPWTGLEEDFLSAWHQAIAKLNPFLDVHPSPVVNDVQRKGVPVRAIMMLHDCYIKDKDPLKLLERELPEVIAWPWETVEIMDERFVNVRDWALEYYRVPEDQNASFESH